MKAEYVFLIIAIVAEVVATSALKASEGFTRLWPSLLVVTGYGVCFYFLAIALKSLPVGITYAVWSGVGIVLIATVGLLWHKEVPDIPAILGMIMIISGVLVIHIFSDNI